MKIIGPCALAALVLIFPNLTLAQTAQLKPKVIVTGDSYTRQSGGCSTNSYAACEQAQQIPHQHSYSLYLNSATSYRVVVSDNSARGGDTCLPGLGTGYLPGGLHAGFDIGLTYVDSSRGIDNVRDRILVRDGNVVTIMIGANDILKYQAPQSQLQACLYNLLVRVGSSGKKVVMMTYPPARSNALLWGSVNANAKITEVNDAIRFAVGLYQINFGNTNVRLVDTSNAWTVSEAPAFTVYSALQQDNVSQFAPDGAHPNTAGGRRLAAAWNQQLCGTGWINC